MSKLNDAFMESYKHLDKICREIFNSDKGITTYIDTMQEINDGNRKLPFWDDVLRKLKNYRYIRNMYVHDVDTSQYDICTKEDIVWLDKFYNSIMETTDPLAEYRRMKKAEKRSASMKKKPITQIDAEEYNLEKKKATHTETETDSSIEMILSFIIISVIITLVILFLLLYI